MNNRKSAEHLLAPSLFFLLLMSQTIGAAAGNNQGLAWGVEAEDRFDYDVELIYHNATFELEIDDHMYVIIGDLPSIVDNATSIVQLSFYNFTIHWDNGTVMDDVWQGVVHLIPFLLFPIGNWTLITRLVEEMSLGAVVVQDSSVFTVTAPPVDELNGTYTIMKSDGALAYLYMDWVRPDMSEAFTVELTREGYVIPTTTSTTTTTTTSTTTTSTTTTTTPTGDSNLLLVLGGLAAAVIVVLMTVFMRRK